MQLVNRPVLVLVPASRPSALELPGPRGRAVPVPLSLVVRGEDVTTPSAPGSAGSGAAPPEASRPSGRPCSCGHGKGAHQHHRRGADCALCDCPRFQRPLLARLRRR